MGRQQKSSERSAAPTLTGATARNDLYEGFGVSIRAIANRILKTAGGSQSTGTSDHLTSLAKTR